MSFHPTSRTPRDGVGRDDASAGSHFVDKLGTTIVVRPFEPADRDDLGELYRTFDPAHRAQGLPPRTERECERWLEYVLDDGRSIVARHDDAVVGHSFYTPATDPVPEFAVFVDPDYHDRGIGTELTRRAVDRARAADRDALVLEVERTNRAAVRVYRKLGFETVEEGRELHMRRPLEGSVAPAARSSENSNE